MTGTFDIYQDNSGKYRWRLTSAKARVIASADDTYDTKSAAITAARAAKRTATGADIFDRTGWGPPERVLVAEADASHSKIAARGRGGRVVAR